MDSNRKFLQEEAKAELLRLLKSIGTTNPTTEPTAVPIPNPIEKDPVLLEENPFFFDIDLSKSYSVIEEIDSLSKKSLLDVPALEKEYRFDVPLDQVFSEEELLEQDLLDFRNIENHSYGVVNRSNAKSEKLLRDAEIAKERQETKDSWSGWGKSKSAIKEEKVIDREWSGWPIPKMKMKRKTYWPVGTKETNWRKQISFFF
jgi:hypothetical protein